MMVTFYTVVLTVAVLLLVFGPRIDRWLRKPRAAKESVQYAPLPQRVPSPIAAATVLDPGRRWPPAPDLPLLPPNLAQQLHDEARAITRQAAERTDTG